MFNGDILIYQPDQELIDEIIELQEQYYRDNKEPIPEYILYMDIIPKLTNIKLNVENELELQQMFIKPKMWLRQVINEIENVLIDISKTKKEQIKTQLK
jgi:ribosomal protein S19